MDKNKKFVLSGVICLLIGLVVGVNYKKELPENIIVKDTVIDSSSIWNSVREDKERIYDIVNKYVKDNSAEGMKYILSLDKKVSDNWLVFHVIPISPDTDVTGLFLEESGGVWIVRGFGTAFPELEVEHPELFK